MGSAAGGVGVASGSKPGRAVTQPRPTLAPAGRRRRRRLGAYALGVVFATGFSASASAEWAVRPLDQINSPASLLYPGAARPLSRDGGVDVVFADNGQAFRTRFTDGQVVPESVVFDSPYLRFNAALDAFGGFSYAGYKPGPPGVTVGDQVYPDPVDPFAYVESPLPFVEPAEGPDTFFWPLSYELDPWGRPAFAAGASNVQGGQLGRYVWRFNPQAARYDVTIPPQIERFGPLSFTAPQGIGFLPDGRLVHAVTDGPLLSVDIEDPLLGWRNLGEISDVRPFGGVSLAVSDAGQVAFAFEQTDDLPGLTVGVFDGEQTVYERVGDVPLIKLGQHSLTYDHQGNLAVVYSGAEDSEFVLARRGVDGQWTQERLGVFGDFAELAFGDQGQVYIGAVTGNPSSLGDVVLISDAVEPLRGDMNLDDQVDLDDVLAFVQAIQAPADYLDQYQLDPVIKGDLNADGVFNLADVEPFADALNLMSTEAAALANLVPEPSAAGLLALGLIGLARRRAGVGSV